MIKYILDTNITSILGKDEQKSINLLEKLSSLSDEDIITVSILTLYESNYGLKNCNNNIQKIEIIKNIDFIKEYFHIVPLDLKEMEIFADLKIAYKNYTGISKKDAKKNDLDLLIASSAIAENAILISNDKIFETIAELDNRLQYENWLK